MEDQAISKGQLRRIQTLWGILWKHGGDGDSRKVRLEWLSLKIGRSIDSCKLLTRAEAKTAIDAMQKLLPPALVKPAPGRDQANAYGRAGRRGQPSQAIQFPDAGTMQLLQNLLAALGWGRARLDLFLHSPKSPVNGQIRTLADANKMIWVLKGMLRRRERQQRRDNVATAGSDGGNGGPNPGPVGIHDRAHV